MAENDFLPFAAAAGANVMTQADYAAATATATGFVSGVASSAAVNKTLRQTSIMAAMIAKFIVDEIGADVIDDGTLDTIIANFVEAIRAANPASGGTVTGVTGTLPITSSGGATPAIGINAATESAAGSMSAADKIKLDSLAQNSDIVHKSGTETITGAKTFSTQVNIPEGALFGSGSSASGVNFPRGAGIGASIWKDTSATDILYIDNVNSSTTQLRITGTTIASISASGATINGLLTCTTFNATSSDHRLKRNIRKFEPRPLHRSTRFVSYTLKANGWNGLGAIAQEVRKVAPEHVGEFEQGSKKYLSLNYAGMAYEQATWAAHEVDRLTLRLAKLERDLDRAKIAPRKRGFVRRLLEAIW